MVKILSPAGSMEAIYAAIAAGADEIYFGGSDFNARQYAKNFTGGEMATAVELCHRHGVKALITLNTLVGDRELSQAIDYAKFLFDIGADALIIQDMGLIFAIRELLPQLELHASTQLSIHNLYGAQLGYSLGCKRVVLARELSKENIEYITANTKAQTEVFVHGALCYSHSGQCLMSAVIGRRSGNRGRCAGPCRLPYSIDGKKDYFLSLKDLCLVDKVAQLDKMGVASLKIEGRMKRAEYVSAVTSVYADAAKGKSVSQRQKQQLADIFSRSGFTDCFYSKNLSKDNLGRKIENNGDNYEKLLAQQRKNYEYLSQQKLTVELPQQTVGFGDEYILATKAEKKSFVKTKTYCFYRSASQAGGENEKVDTIYLPVKEVLKNIKTGAQVGIHFPKIITDDEVESFEKDIASAANMGIKKACIENIGQIEIAKKYHLDYMCGISFNVFNTLSAKAFYSIGADSVCVSAECSFPQIRDIAKYCNVGMYAYGRLPLMTSESCVMKNSGKCQGKGCKLPTVISDRVCERFPVFSEPNCRNTIYNSKVVWLADKKKDLKALGLLFIGLFFTDEDKAQCKEVIEAYTSNGGYRPEDYTRAFTDKKVL